MTLIDHHPSAPLGSVSHLDQYDIETFSHEDAILCRNTAPLVSMAFGFIRRNVGVRILGRDIGAGLVTLILKLKGVDTLDLEHRLREWCNSETRKLYARGHEASAAAVEDKVTCIQVFIDNLDNKNISDLILKIESLFSDNNRGLLTLCTIHKAKGLEWPTVFILDRNLYMPSKWAQKSWELKQENNLLYVAVTRAKLNLRYISSGRWIVPLSEEAKVAKVLETL